MVGSQQIINRNQLRHRVAHELRIRNQNFTLGRTQSFNIAPSFKWEKIKVKLSTTPYSWTYSSTYSWPRHYMTGSYQLHILATLLPEKCRGTVLGRNRRQKYFRLTWRWKVKVKANQSLYRAGRSLRVARGCDSRISRQSAHEGSKNVSPTQRPLLSPENNRSTRFC